MLTPTELTELTLDDFSCASRGPALVAFASLSLSSNAHASELLGKLSRDFGDRVRIGYLDTDLAPNVSSRIHIQSPLTLVVFCLGEPFAHVFGFHELPALRRWLTQSLRACSDCESSLGV